MKFLIPAFAAALAIGTMPQTAMAQSSGTEVDRDGSCPTGFKSKGSSCVSTGGKVAITKIGSCPSGFKSSAKYCVGDSGDYAEVRDGDCPTGLKTSGKYCVK
ncbi:hypothetical protein [Altererythrobacter sp. MTPC7]|uniref:hypothetical protein n=1 Tax=Altererythrobacter sp. MTPC7 TaxID=3056567 RepID=UPI0036F22FD2